MSQISEISEAHMGMYILKEKKINYSATLVLLCHF